MTARLLHKPSPGGEQSPCHRHRDRLSTPAVPPPRLTAKGVLAAGAFWAVYTFVGAIPLRSYVSIPLEWALVGQLIPNCTMALLSIPAWLLVVRGMDRYNWRWKVAVHILIAPAYALAIYWINIGALSLMGVTEAVRSIRSASQWIVFSNFTCYILQFSIYHGIQTVRKLRFKEQQAAELLTLAREQELIALKSQINPHFLFNTLNGISAMAARDPEETRTMIAELGDLLRYANDMSRKDVVPLRDELGFTSSFLALESRRLGERLQIDLNVDEKAKECLVPPMILQPLVENAIRHGIEPSEQGGNLGISVAVNGGVLDVSIRDTASGGHGGTRTANGTGIGLRNTDARLYAMFGESSRLKTRVLQPGGFEVTFSIPLEIRSEL